MIAPYLSPTWLNQTKNHEFYHRACQMNSVLFKLPIALPYANAILFALESALGIFVFPILATYAAYWDTRHCRKFYKFKSTWRHHLTAGHEPRLFSLSCFFITAAVSLALVYGLDATEIGLSIPGTAEVLVRNTNFSQRADRDLTLAVNMCKTLKEDNTNVYAFPVLYDHGSPLYAKRRGNTDNDKLIGLNFVSCEGYTKGATLPISGRPQLDLKVRIFCCDKCNKSHDAMKDSGWFMTSVKNKSRIERQICTMDSTPLVKAAFGILRRDAHKFESPYETLNDEIIPSLICRRTSRREKRLYVFDEIDGTKIGWSAVAIVLPVLLSLPCLVHFFALRWNHGEWRWVHGSTDSDLLELWAVMARAQNIHMDDKKSITWYIRCPIYGGLKLEEDLIGENSEMLRHFDRRRIYMEIVQLGRSDLRKPIFDCPLCQLRHNTNIFA